MKLTYKSMPVNQMSKFGYTEMQSRKEEGWQKLGKSVFHLRLKQYMAYPSCRLPSLQYFPQECGHNYDFMCYFDSDAARSKSLSDALFLRNNYGTMVYLVNRNIYEILLLFFSYFSLKDNLPWDGIILFKPWK